MSDSPALQPFDAYNKELEAAVHPTDWKNPTPQGKYNLVVIGAGTAGLVTAAGAAGLGAKVALIERDLMGGDCLNVGCVPSKAVISAAKSVAALKKGQEFGVNVEASTFDFGKAMERMRAKRAGISHHDSARRFTDLGVDVFLGDAKFSRPGFVSVAGQELRYKKAVIATGARAAKLPIDGLEEVPYLTNENVFSLTELPGSMAVIGGGPIGCELAQSFARFGTEVVQIEKSARILPREEQDAALVVQQQMEKDGVQFVLNASTTRVEKRGDMIAVTVDQQGEQREIVVSKLLVGAGRSPNVEGLGLEEVGVEYDLREGVLVDDKLQTTGPNIYAAGDVCSRFKFTHAADFMARIVIQNALFFGRKKLSGLTIPWATYTSPELAHVGIYPDEAKAKGIELDTYTQGFDGVDRAILEGDEDGFVRVHTKKGTDQILGATIVGSQAGEMISEITLAMTHGLSLGKFSSTIHPYPTVADAIRKTADQYTRTRLTPFVKKLFNSWLAWHRK